MPFTAPPAFTTRPDLTGTSGMTASTHWIATATGQAVLERRGNAFDAAVAAAFVLHLVEPHPNGHRGWSPQQAIDGPAFHTTSFPGSFWTRTSDPAGLVVEDRLGEEVIEELEARGHVVTRVGDWTLGRLTTVGREPATGVLHAAANARAMQSSAAGR